jgi:formate dehydrogenase maturation protein FdhE
MLSQKKYIEKEGGACPVCGSREVSAYTNNFDCDGIYAWVPVTCPDCEHDWVETYEMTGYTDLNDPNGNRVDYPSE